ncbi:tyrosine-type recombinase/integrase [Aquimarina aggregata]|nr:site-specific integrase [Aquimarina aggregata]
MMTIEYSISIYLDKRRAKANGKFPVRLRVFTPSPRKQKLYPTAFDFTEKEFDSIWLTTKPRKEYKETRLKLQAVENKVNEVASQIIPFSFTQFEKKLYRKVDDGVKVSYHYKEKISEYKKYDRISTADSYQCSENAFKKFMESKHQNYDNLTLLDINKEWLQDFEQYMQNKGRSLTTVGIYLRPLRAVFNKAIDEGEIEKELYPFGKRKYQIPTSKKVKKALNKEQMKKLFQAKPTNKEQQKAKDFWFLSYNCNGMNMKDIAQLKYKDITENKIIFYRAKTLFTSKTDLKPITVYLNEYIEKIIYAYGNPNKLADNHVFDVLEGNETPERQQVKIKNFTRYINQHLKKLCEANELPGAISTYWARHSFATLSVQKGATMEFMQESLGHKDMATTQSYFAGFDDDTKKEFAENLMDFD